MPIQESKLLLLSSAQTGKLVLVVLVLVVLVVIVVIVVLVVLVLVVLGVLGLRYSDPLQLLWSWQAGLVL
jgi:hypothetical protein